MRPGQRWIEPVAGSEDRNDEAAWLDATIKKNFEELGV